MRLMKTWAKGMRRRRSNWPSKGSPDHRKVGRSKTGLSGMQLSSGEGKKVVDKPCSGLRRVENGRRNIWESGILNRCQKMHSKCQVQTLYSPGIAQDCVVTIDKV